MIFFTRNLFCLNSKVFFLVLRRSYDFFFTRDLFCLNSKFFFLFLRRSDDFFHL